MFMRLKIRLATATQVNSHNMSNNLNTVLSLNNRLINTDNLYKQEKIIYTDAMTTFRLVLANGFPLTIVLHSQFSSLLCKLIDWSLLLVDGFLLLLWFFFFVVVVT